MDHFRLYQDIFKMKLPLKKKRIKEEQKRKLNSCYKLKPNQMLKNRKQRSFRKTTN